MYLAIRTIDATVSVLSLVIFVYSLLSFVLDPYHPLRQTLSRAIEPILMPIRRIVPPLGGLDFSAWILIIIIQIIGALLKAVIRSLA